MYVVIGIHKIRAEHLDQYLRHVREHAAASEREPGCLRYHVLQDTIDPAIICLHEVFRDEAAFHAHLEMPHYKRWMDISRDWRDHSARQRWVMDYVHPDPSLES